LQSVLDHHWQSSKDMKDLFNSGGRMKESKQVCLFININCFKDI